MNSTMNEVEEKVVAYLYPPSGRLTDGAQVKAITLAELLTKIGVLVDKLTPGRFYEKQAAAALRRLGWVKKRDSAFPRKWMYYRPDNESHARRYRWAGALKRILFR